MRPTIFLKWAVAVFAGAALLVSCAKEEVAINSADAPTTLEQRSIITPTTVPGWKSGDAAFECGQFGSGCNDFAWKIDASAPNGTYNTTSTMYGNTPTTVDANITIYDSDGYSFSWSSDLEVCKVIVKGGTSANVYDYAAGFCGDETLEAPINPNNGTPFEISHVTFCFSDIQCNGGGTCYQEETAWTQGERYTRRGNWAMYTEYEDGLVVDIIAGQNMIAGTATFADLGGGQVSIMIMLNPEWIFYYDLSNPNGDANIKIQGYDNPPSGNPAPGKFQFKAVATVAQSMYTMVVPERNYYGIHLDVAYEVPCQ